MADDDVLASSEAGEGGSGVLMARLKLVESE
jgi:hypothetical protein